MMSSSNDLILGYSLDKWNGYGLRQPITTDVSSKTNSHVMCCGMSGSGKSFQINLLMARICSMENAGTMYFADFKQDDQFSYLRKCPRYFPYEKTIEAVEIVYEIMQKRQSGDSERFPVTLVIDEYVAFVLAMQNVSKKKADEIMRKISEILMLGRSLSVRLITSCQRPDATAFPLGSRLNYGIIIVVGAAIKSIYEMLIPKEYIDTIGDRKFGIGEGVVLLQGTQMEFIKIPMVHDVEKMQQICINALTQ